MQIYPPSSVAVATASPQGEAFCKISFVLHNKANRQKIRSIIYYLLSCLSCLHNVKKASPWGGDQSALAKGIHSPTRPLTNQARSRTLQQVRTSPSDKNFPREHPHRTKRNKSLPCTGGCSWGKFSVREGGLEGESPVFQEGALSLQGLSPLPPRSSFPYPTPAPLQTPSRGKWGSWGSECRVRRARGRRSTRQAPVNPSRGKALQPSEETEATGAEARQNPRET